MLHGADLTTSVHVYPLEEEDERSLTRLAAPAQDKQAKIEAIVVISKLVLSALTAADGVEDVKFI